MQPLFFRFRQRDDLNCAPGGGVPQSVVGIGGFSSKVEGDHIAGGDGLGIQGVAGKIPAAGGFPQTDLAGELTAVLYGSDIDAVFLRTNGGDKSAEIHRAAGGGKVDQSAAAYQKQYSQQYPFCCVFHEYPSFVLSVA